MVIVLRKRKITEGQKILIVLLTLLFIGNCSYIFYDKVFVVKKKETKCIEEKQDEDVDKKVERVKRSLSMAEEKMLLEQIDDYNTYLASFYPISDIKSLSNQQKLLFAYLHMEKQGQKEFMQSEIKKNLEYFFGRNHGVIYEDILCDHGDGVLYTYDKAARVYTFSNEHGHDGISLFQVYTFLIDGSVLDEKEYFVDVKSVYGPYCSGTCGPVLTYYKSAKDAEERKDALLTREREEGFTEHDYQKVENQLDTVRFSFQKDDRGNYGLTSVTFVH